jgi:poly(3-hydroxyalkanoate) depolymerase
MSETLDVRGVDVGSQRLRIAIRRPDEPRGRPLLLCNGLGASLESFESLVAELDGIETITFDAPGVGGSPAPLVPYRFRGLARLLDRLLDRLGYGEVDVLGVSWGGGLAQQLAFSHPARCRRLILVASAAGALMIPGRPSVLSKLLTPRRYVDASYREQIAPTVYGGDYRRNPELARAHVRAGREPNWLGYWYQLMATVGWSSLPWLPFLTQPTLVLHGTDDPLVPVVNARILAALIPGAELQLLDCGHLLVLTRVAEVSASILRFREAEPPSPATEL